MDLDQEENEEIEQDIEDREGDDKTTGFEDIKEEPNEEAEEEEKEDDPLDIDYQQEDKETEGANTDVDEGPTGRPNPQDLTQTDMTASSGANANASVQQDEPMGEGGNETEIPMSVNDQKGMGDANQNTTEKEKLESKKQKQNQSINPHRKFGEAMEKWKLDVSVSMDLQEADKTADDLDDIQDEYAYDTGNENTEGGPEALGQAHENNENDDAPLGNEKKEAEEADADKAEDDHHENVTLKESHDAIQQKQENSAKPEDKSVKEKCEEDEEMADAEEEAEGPGEGDVKLKYDTQIHVSNTNFGLGEERDQYNAVENRVAKLDIQETNEGRMRWYESSSSVASLVGELTEQLRLTLTPTQISKMAGDFRTGKRLNIRKLIPYIASNFKKDKIWLRRTQPDKRKYQILLAVDDSRSMIENNCEKFALDSIALMCNSMTRLEVGDLGILSFGGSAGVTELHALGKPFDNSSGVSISSSLTFKQESTVQQQPVLRLLEDGLHIFQKSRQSLNMFDKPDGLHQLFLIVADGRINEGDVIKSMIQDALAEGGLMIVFIILDTSKNSLIDVKTVDFVDGMPVLKRYMDSFPFPYYILLREIHSLPRTLADLIRQWVEVTLTQG
jgi:midasin